MIINNVSIIFIIIIASIYKVVVVKMMKVLKEEIFIRNIKA